MDEIDPSAVDRLWTLNSIVPVLPTRAALPYLLASGSGGVITVASLLAFGGGHGSEFPRVLYAGAKAATAAFARTLAGELPALVSSPSSSAVRLHAEIAARGYNGSSRSVRRYLQPLRAALTAPALPRPRRPSGR